MFTPKRLIIDAQARHRLGPMLELRSSIGFKGAVFVTLLLLIGCASPVQQKRIASYHLTTAEISDTLLAKASSQAVATSAQSGQSGVHLLSNPQNAFASRIVLAKAAERSIDIQYYIWEKDVTGTLMLQAMFEAAERGVRVRILLDDNGIRGLDEGLATLNQHPNVQIRLFNPFNQRRLKWLGYITDFSRVNRRMHNKSFTADNSVTIIGGRNIGDDYFGATSGILKQDLDLVAIGDVVQAVSEDFDRYWQSESAFPIETIVKMDEAATFQVEALYSKQVTQDKKQKYLQAIRESTFIEDLLAMQYRFQWSEVSMVSDDPAKGIGRHDESGLLINRLKQILGNPQQRLILISPYFVPTDSGVKALTELAQLGVNISVLTNSMEATDVLPVHAGYAKHRKDLLKAGITLYEMRASSDEKAMSVRAFGSSASSLHAKTFMVDSARMFVGSFNFDPRSTRLNTELGFVIENPKLTSQSEEEFYRLVGQVAYQVKLDENGNLYWLSQEQQQSVKYETEPGMSIFKRTALGILSILPIDWLL